MLDTSAQVIFNEPSDLDSFTYSHVVLNPRFQIINNQLLGIICIYLNEKEGKYSTRAELIIVDYSNLKNLQVVRRINFGSEIYDWPNEEFYYRLYSYNEEIQLTWRYPKKTQLMTRYLELVVSFPWIHLVMFWPELTISRKMTIGFTI